MQIYEIELFGIIQGVGFRPFVYTLARQMGLKGYVQNRYTSLFILLGCTPNQQREFLTRILSAPPPNALIEHHEVREWESLYSWRQAQVAQNLDTENRAVDDLKILESLRDFEILPSSPTHLAGGTLKSSPASHFAPSFLPQDVRICPDCLSEMRQGGRFENYAFTTCTNCGARYSILKALPYDRIHTSMSEFPMCSACQSEYDNPQNRRFHAQPHSCLECAVRLQLIDEQGEAIRTKCAQDDIGLIKRVAEAIENGAIVAIEGVGGFNLVASAKNKETIATLRRRKNRPHKPFALMFKTIEQIEAIAHVSQVEREALQSAAAPIVLLNRRFGENENMESDNIKKREHNISESSPSSSLPPLSSRLDSEISPERLSLIAPNVATIGAILPYNGIMHLLFDFIHAPLIFTSANLSGEPIISDIESLKEKLGGVYDMALFYNRRILHAIDDSIVRFMGGSMRVLRLARGFAPYQFSFMLPFNLADKKGQNKAAQKPLLAIGMGAQQKLTLSFLFQNLKHQGIASKSSTSPESSRIQALISPYIGDFGGVESYARYKEDFEFFSSLYRLQEAGEAYALCVGSDLHPRYHSTAFATTLKKRLPHAKAYALSHHKAHFYAILAESGGLADSGLGIVWDGTGLGEDGRIWGGECFAYEPIGKLNAKNVSDSEISESSPKIRYVEMRRVGHFEEFILLGGESAIRDIYKSALSLLWQCGLKSEAETLWEAHGGEKSTYDMLCLLHQRGLKQKDAILTSSVGRLFDAVAYILGLLKVQSYEGQSGTYIESAALRALEAAKTKGTNALDSENASFTPTFMPPFAPLGFEIDTNGVVKLGAMVGELIASRDSQGVEVAAWRFIETLAHIVVALFERFGGRGGEQKKLYLSGGVFQNKLLCDRIHALCQSTHNLSPIMHTILPCNDSGISFGQAVYAILQEMLQE